MSAWPRLSEWEGHSLRHWATEWGIPRLLAFRQVGSTNDEIRAAALAGAPAGTTALAELQTTGRGRLGRSWAAPAGTALLLSVLFRPGPGGAPEAAAILPLRVGLALSDAITRVCGQVPAIKWPNDLLLSGRKVAGILCEAAADFVVVGIGLNVTQEEPDFPTELRPRATSLRLATGRTPERSKLARTILGGLKPLFTAPHRPLDPAELGRLAALDALAGHAISVDDAPAGIARGIDATGALRVEQEGRLTLVHAGTVRSLA